MQHLSSKLSSYAPSVYWLSELLSINNVTIIYQLSYRGRLPWVILNGWVDRCLLFRWSKEYRVLLNRAQRLRKLGISSNLESLLNRFRYGCCTFAFATCRFIEGSCALLWDKKWTILLFILALRYSRGFLVCNIGSLVLRSLSRAFLVKLILLTTSDFAMTLFLALLLSWQHVFLFRWQDLIPAYIVLSRVKLCIHDQGTVSPHSIILSQ